MKNAVRLALIILALLPASAQKAASPNQAASGDVLLAWPRVTPRALTYCSGKFTPTCRRFLHKWKLDSLRLNKRVT